MPLSQFHVYQYSKFEVLMLYLQNKMLLYMINIHLFCDRKGYFFKLILLYIIIYMPISCFIGHILIVYLTVKIIIIHFDLIMTVLFEFYQLFEMQ